MFSAEPLDDSVHRYRVPELTFADAVDRWRDDAAFRKMFNQVLADSPFSAFFWETPPVTPTTTEQPFEFVLVDSRGLAGVARDHIPFREHICGVDDAVVTFANLGRDAILVVPTQQDDANAYAHLADFARRAPTQQVDALWRSVADAVAQRLVADAGPLWLSTCGTGVYWLHIRLDQRPKYYSHAPYRQLGSRSTK